jgi:hypothetical protein
MTKISIGIDLTVNESHGTLSKTLFNTEHFLGGVMGLNRVSKF